jgi:hypothetical protein
MFLIGLITEGRDVGVARDVLGGLCDFYLYHVKDEIRDDICDVLGSLYNCLFCLFDASETLLMTKKKCPFSV